MKWEIVLVYLVVVIIYENIGAEIVRPNHGWGSQTRGLKSNRQNENCPDTCMCGIPNKKTRIIGGHPARLIDYPWVAFVQSQTENGTFNCGGSLIKDRYIVTAAHCIKASASNTLAVLLLENTRNITSIVKIHRIREIIVHPGWDISKTGLNNDIALLKLLKPVKFDVAMGADDYIAPLCIANDSSQTFDGVNASSIGWGLTNGNDVQSKSRQLLEVFVDVVKDDNCKRQFGSKLYNSETMMCAGTSDGSLGTCGGDSGGPLHQWATASDGTLYNQIIGLVSFGGKLCDTHSVYTRITKYHEWINENTADGCGCSRPS